MTTSRVTTWPDAGTLSGIEKLALDSGTAHVSLTTDRLIGMASQMIITRQGSKIVAKNSSGTIVSSGTVFATVFNAAVNGLTSARTHVERISVIGSYDVTNYLTLDSKLYVDLTQAALTVSTSLPTNIGILSAVSKSDVYIEGGEINCNGNINHGILFDGSSRVGVYKTIIKDTDSHNIKILDTTDFVVSNANCSKSGDDAITALNSSNGVIIGNRLAAGSNNTSFGGQSFGVEIEDGSKNICISSNIITADPSASGTTNVVGGILITSNPSQALCSDITITNNVIKGMTNYPIYVESQLAVGAGAQQRIVVSNNIVEDTANSGGIRFSNCLDFSVTNNVFTGLTGSTALYGLWFNDCSGFTVTGGSVSNVGVSGVYIEDCTEYTVSGTQIKNVGQRVAGYGIQLLTTGIQSQNASISNVVVSDDQSTVTSRGIFLSTAQDLTVTGGSVNNLLDSVSHTSALSASVKVSGVTGYKTTVSGSATLTGGSGNVDVLHGLDRTPIDGQLRITPTNAAAASLAWFTPDSQMNSTKFRIVGSPSTDATFSWEIIDAGYNQI